MLGLALIQELTYESAAFAEASTGRTRSTSWTPLSTRPAAPVRFHDLRHTCVSLLLDLGVAPHVVKEIVGHSAIDVTMTIYAHTSLHSRRAALKLLDERLSEAS